MASRLSRFVRRPGAGGKAGAPSKFVLLIAKILRTDEVQVRRWGWLILTSFLVTSLMFVVRSASMLKGAETWWLDRMASVDSPPFNAPITVVSITDRDYYDPDLFGGTSPLDPEGLNRIVRRVLLDRPRGIVLDVQIHPAMNESPERSAARLKLYEVLSETADAGTLPIVLVRNVHAEELEPTGDPVLQAAWRNLTENGRISWADPSIEREGGFVRGIPQRYEDEGRDETSLPTVLGAAIEAFGLVQHREVPFWARHEEEGPSEPRRIRFSGHFMRDELGLTAHHSDVGALLSSPHVEGTRSLLTDRYVLIGGNYHAGRDTHPTVVGDMAGVFVWAEAIGSWYRDDALRELTEPLAFVLEFILGVLGGLLMIKLGSGFGFVSQLLIIVPLAILFSIMTFGDRVLFINFLPAAFSVYVHYQFDLHVEVNRLRRRLASVGKASPAAP